MKSLRRYFRLVVLAAAWAPAAVCAQIALNQVNTFQDGMTDGWTDGSGGDNLAVIATGGPTGSGDEFLQVSSGSFGGEPHLITFNDTEWLGNYTAAGVTAVSMELINFGPVTLPIRLALRTGSSGSATPGYASTTPFMLPADGQWYDAVFLLDSADLTAINSPPPLATLLDNVGDFRLLSSASPALTGDMINAQIGVDDIRATVIPEPASVVLVAAVFGVGAVLRRRKKNQIVTC